ncbi:DUF3341 domain-containing protein [Marinilongibacter aquaticus]|uniref:DUF3341 domain-containing protein n=1 Tax=Marinilongibacter aquaticus TaxID=2975157 RepID=UPI0021BD82E3|nr:DUF3341 domain-containing protein [Marinilongibacter aquaticus]UBM57280.1 DUF3341 domain-containing protein [Marinilongibacter aquaticus]
MAHKKYILGVFEDEDVVKNAVTDIRGKGVNIHEVYSPYPVHGLDHVLGYARPRMGVAAFLFGLTGTCLAFLLTFWTLGFDWPMNIGGKNFIPFPTNIPIVFELTVLLASYGMAFTFFGMERLTPLSKPVIFDERITDDKFVMAIELGKNKVSESDIQEALKNSGASEVNLKEI